MNPTHPQLRVIHPEAARSPGAARREPGRLPTAFTADELMAMNFPEPRWAVPGILAEGVNLLAGPPKVGKSWLALGLGLDIAHGGRAFGAIPTQGGPVLYLALEDTPRRLQTRVGKILAGRPAPPGLTLATACPTLPQGGTEAIASWLGRHTDARMVVIDVFAKMRGQPPPGASAYEGDYTAVTRAKQLADDHGVAVVLVHHVRKAEADDFLTEVSGTNGLTGAADATLVLKRPRGQADGVLHLTGRDVEETEYALAFQPTTGTWNLLDGPAHEHTLPDTRATILRHLRHNPDSTPKVIAEHTGLGGETVKKTCQRMNADGQLHADTTGRYRIPRGHPDTPESVPAVPGVPEPPLTCGNTTDHEGHLGDRGVPGVPEPPLTCEHAVVTGEESQQ
ncbi:MAG: AAA family ATPase [Carbonactinosporaceae bacterium]